jgi:asparagine synthase (glutamine-hydrolysing)
MRGKLPPDILARPKKGFGIPIAQWLRSDLKQMALDTFSEQRIRQQGLFDHRAVSRLLDEHLRGKKDHRKQLWTLLMFQSWFEQYMGS